MILNTQQLHCLVEIQRTRSVSHAAANLYMSQPNLSRILRDTEAAVGFPIFERTRRGVRPTEKGAILLGHARNMLREADFIEGLGAAGTNPNRFRVCLPRSYAHIQSTTRFLQSLAADRTLDAMIRECHPRQALDLLESGSAEVAVIRFSVEYQDYFSEQMEQRALTMKPLGQVRYQILVSRSSPLAGRTAIAGEVLKRYTEILHRDVFYPRNQPREKQSSIYTVDRLSQLQMLQLMPNAYLWSEPLEQGLLQRWELVQIPCGEAGALYQEALVYKPKGPMSETERSYVHFMLSAGGR